MNDTIIIILVLLIFVVALLRMKKHFKGGGCCGSGSNTIRVKKTLTEPEIGKLVLTVEGMTCQNCQARVENVLNRFDGVACTVDLKKKTATVRCSRKVSADSLTAAVEKLGYQVTDIQ